MEINSNRTENIAQYGILIIAVSAMFISVWQGFQTQRHNRLSVRPYFTFSNNTNVEENRYQVVLSNQGYGPGIIKEYEISVDGKVYDGLIPAMSALDTTILVTQATTYFPGDVIASNTVKSILQMRNYKKSDRIVIRIKYESIYEEVFEIENVF